MRNDNIDSLKLISIIAVIFIHIAQYRDTVLGSILDQTTRFAVPYFFIIAGYFFFNKVNREPKSSITILTRYITRLGIIYIFWYAIYAAWPLFNPAEHITITDWANNFIEKFSTHPLDYMIAGGEGVHLWFLPSLGIAIALLTLSIKFNTFTLGILLAIGLFIVGLVMYPYKKLFPDLPSIDFDPRNGPFFSSVFVFIGAYLAKRKLTPSKELALLVTIAGLALSLAEVFLLQTTYGIPMYTHNFVLGTIPYGVGVALLAMSSANLSLPFKAQQLGKYTLGIYAIHVLIIWLLYSLNLWSKYDAIMLMAILVLSIGSVLILKKVPVFKQFVE